MVRDPTVGRVVAQSRRPTFGPRDTAFSFLQPKSAYILDAINIRYYTWQQTCITYTPYFRNIHIYLALVLTMKRQYNVK